MMSPTSLAYEIVRLEPKFQTLAAGLRVLFIVIFLFGSAIFLTIDSLWSAVAFILLFMGFMLLKLPIVCLALPCWGWGCVWR